MCVFDTARQAVAGENKRLHVKATFAAYWSGSAPAFLRALHADPVRPRHAHAHAHTHAHAHSHTTLSAHAHVVCVGWGCRQGGGGVRGWLNWYELCKRVFVVVCLLFA
jgi:hypothetical protein